MDNQQLIKWMAEIASANVQVDITTFKHDILKYVQTPEEAEAIALTLASLNWKKEYQTYHEKERNELIHQMQRAFQQWQTIGGECANCGENYRKLYAWPHQESNFSFFKQNKKYCWVCIRKEQNDLERWHPEGFWKKHHCMARCDNCKRMFPEKNVYRLTAWEAHEKVRGSYCINCVEKISQERFAFCRDCNKKFAKIQEGQKVCVSCKEKQAPYQALISSHLARARKADTPATLTLQEWINTLEYFNYACAYCYTDVSSLVLEHVQSISFGGGTEKSNCVPACQTCNSRKAGKPASKLHTIFPQDVLDKINAYLRSEQTPSNQPYIDPSRALVKL